jgi:pyruvate/2-oxoglutarate dehydrogenase complex dihydrolipoamide acyltransferase (E2) component
MLTGIKMPKMAELDEYKILRFHHKAGDVVRKGEIFMDVLLDDGTERPVGFYLSGKITEITATVGSYVREDYLLGVMDDSVTLDG